jgi:hypothetical protein
MKDSIWLADPEEHDFPAAQDYLDLLFSAEQITEIVNRLQWEKTILKKLKTF